jgi:cell division protein FtsQ
MTRQYRLADRSAREKAPFPSPAFILAIIILVGVGFGFYRFANYLVTKSQMFTLKEVRVEGNRWVEKNDILNLAKIEAGVRLYRVPTDSVVKRILQNPYLQGVSVSRSLPSTLIITVQERTPVAYLIDSKVYMIDRFGKILLKKPAMSLENLPLITGLSVSRLLQNRDPLFQALGLIRTIDEVDEGLFNYISEVHIDSRTPPTLFLIRGGAIVEIGESSPYERIYKLSELINNTPILNKLDQIKKIDLTFSDRVIVTRKS